MAHVPRLHGRESQVDERALAKNATTTTTTYRPLLQQPAGMTQPIARVVVASVHAATKRTPLKRKISFAQDFFSAATKRIFMLQLNAWKKSCEHVCIEKCKLVAVEAVKRAHLVSRERKVVDAKVLDDVCL